MPATIGLFSMAAIRMDAVLASTATPPLRANQAVAETGEFLFLPNRPVEMVAYQRAGDIDKVKTAGFGEAKGGAIEGALAVIERRLLGFFARQDRDEAARPDEGAVAIIERQISDTGELTKVIRLEGKIVKYITPN